MLDLSAFAIGLVGGWSLLFLRWPPHGVRARGLVAAIWLLWALVLAALARSTGVAVVAGAGLGFAGHAMLVLRLQKRGL
jgi:hypothetical protein